MRKSDIACLVIALTVVTAGTAIAGEATSPEGQIQTFEVAQRSSGTVDSRGRTGTKVKISTTLRSANGGLAFAYDDLRLDLPKGLVPNRNRFPKCDRERLSLRGRGACPKRSLVGRGTAVADARPLFAAISARIFLYNGTDDTFLWYAEPSISSPVILEGQFVRSRARGFGRSLDFDFPFAIPEDRGTPITRMDLEIGATLREASGHGSRRRINEIPYLRLSNPCRNGMLRWQMFVHFRFGDSLTVGDVVPCAR